jgi:hypothetical protein
MGDDRPFTRRGSLPGLKGVSPDYTPKYRDPAYIVLLIAVVVALVSGCIFTVVASSFLKQFSFFDNSNANQSAAYQTAPAQSFQGQNTIDSHPIFPPPGSTPGNTLSSQPPRSGTPTFAVPTVTITVAPTITAAATVTPAVTPTGPFTVHILSYPPQALNNTTIQVQVATGQPNIALQLTASYTLLPFIYQTNPQLTDTAGNATIAWPITLYSSVNRHGSTTTTARFSIRGQSPDAQSVTSQTQTILILMLATG